MLYDVQNLGIDIRFLINTELFPKLYQNGTEMLYVYEILGMIASFPNLYLKSSNDVFFFWLGMFVWIIMFGKLILKSGNEVWWILFVLFCFVKVFYYCLALQVGLNGCLYNKLPPWWGVHT